MKKLIIFLSIGYLFLGCEKKEVPVQEPEDLNQYGLDATFDNGQSVHFKQFNPETSDEGLLTTSCFFMGDQMAIAFAGTNYLDQTKSNGFSAGFSVAHVTSQRAYEFAKENPESTNTSSFLKRVWSGSAASSPSPLVLYDNSENYRRFPKGDGFCDEEEIAVDFQTIDITRYSEKHGGTIEGTFDIRVYNKPEDNCQNYKKERITGVFKLKRINFK